MCACGLIGTKVGLNWGTYRHESPYYLLICIVFTHRLLFNESAASESRAVQLLLRLLRANEPRSSSGLGRRPLTPVTRVQIPYGVHIGGFTFLTCRVHETTNCQTKSRFSFPRIGI